MRTELKAVHDEKTVILVGVCTCNRPIMLSKCLSSLSKLFVPEGIQVEVAVASNGPYKAEQNRTAAQRLEAASNYKVHFHHSDQPGISKARNRILDIAASRDVDWVFFIDDDEEADPMWASALLSPEYLDTPVLTGLRTWIYPDPSPFWFLPPKPTKYKEGETLTYALTSNVRLSRALIDAGLRFNEKLGFMGGEDIEFFAEAHAQGFGIKRTLKAITIETAHRERLTYFSQLYQSYWSGASIVRRRMVEDPPWKVVGSYAITAPYHFAIGCIELIASPLFVVGGLQLFKRRALGGGKKIARAFGRIAAMPWLTPQPYKNTVGR